MPKITRTTQPSVGASNLPTVQQSINVPRGAFGGQIAEAQTRFGSQLQQSGNQLGEIALRQQLRENETVASSAAAQARLEEAEAYETHKGDPGDLNTFTDRVLADFDKRNSERSKNMNSAAKQLFEEKMLSQRTNVGKSSINFKSTEFIKRGKASVEDELGAIIRTAGTDLQNLPSYYAQLKDAVAKGQASGFLGKSGKRAEQETRRLTSEVTNNLLHENPAMLLSVLDGDILEGLKGSEKNTLLSKAISAIKNLEEKATVTKLASVLVNNQEVMDSYENGTLTYKDVDELERAGTIDARVSEYLKEDLTVPEDLSFEAKVEKSVEQKKINIEARERLGLVKEEKPKPPSIEEKLRTEGSLASRFLEFGYKKEDGEPALDNTETRLSDLLDFQADIMYAAKNKLITREKAATWRNKLLPIMRDRIESKHFQGNEGFFGFGQRAEDPYTPGFNYVLGALEKTPGSNTLENQVRAVDWVVSLSQELKLDQIEDPVKRRSALLGVGKQALDMLNKQNYPELGDVEDMPSTIIPKIPSQVDYRRHPQTGQWVKIDNGKAIIVNDADVPPELRGE